MDDTIVSLIASAIESYGQSDEAESVWSILEPALKEAGYDTSQSIIDFRS